MTKDLIKKCAFDEDHRKIIDKFLWKRTCLGARSRQCSNPHSFVVQQRQFLTTNNTIFVPHPPVSPNLAPSDIFLFPRMKRKVIE
ncbi:hypothetical protein TNCV_3346661 [Trichonephila clavipes]|nr:hypothetical protein TNCV_3346661 [Trichonephila clavipes]